MKLRYGRLQTAILLSGVLVVFASTTAVPQSESEKKPGDKSTVEEVSRRAYSDGYRDGYRDAFREGYREGHQDGYKLGFSEGKTTH